MKQSHETWSASLNDPSSWAALILARTATSNSDAVAYPSRDNEARTSIVTVDVSSRERRWNAILPFQSLVSSFLRRRLCDKSTRLIIPDVIPGNTPNTAGLRIASVRSEVELNVSCKTILMVARSIGVGSGVGAGEGAGVGISEGSCEGIGLGCGLGSGVGKGVGIGRGIGLGWGLGIGVGGGVGSGLGICVGTGVGKGLGTVLGTDVGTGDGSGVGRGLGKGEGDGVGTSVGSGVGNNVG